MVQTTLRDYLQETEDAISSNRIDQALANCQYILARFPDSLEAQRLLGEVYLAQGRVEEALQTFDWVLTNDPENVIAYCDRALISERMSDYDTALDCYQQAYELSKGNSQIRQEFNQLSAKAGQPGFMFSRAGLARLYMRGDLLTQAIQEWENVLSGSPERLDARLGLLETYWREGMFERVEQLAMQILLDVPGCLKALLLQGYVIVSKNMQQAQDLLRRAEALDPDLIMAHELFADLLARQPNEPFLTLLNRAPVILDPAEAGKSVATPSTQNSPVVEDERLRNPLADAPTATGVFSGWSGLENWDGEGTLIKNQEPPSQVSAELPLWARNSPSAAYKWDVEQQSNGVVQPVQKMPEANPEVSADVTPFPPASSPTPAKEEVTLDSWTPLLSAADDSPLAESNEAPSQPWNKLSDSQYADPWSSLSTGSSTGASGTSWNLEKNESSSGIPSWLSMLNQGDRQQMGGEMPSIPPTEQKLQIPSPPPQSALEQDNAVRQNLVQQPVAQESIDSRIPASAKPEARDLSRESNQPKPSVPSDSQPKLPSVLPTMEQQQATPMALPPWLEERSPALSDDEDDSLFGPAWLRSMGATSIDGEDVEKEPLSGLPPFIAKAEMSPASSATWQPPVANSQPTPTLFEPQDSTALSEREQIISEPTSIMPVAPVERPKQANWMVAENESEPFSRRRENLSNSAEMQKITADHHSLEPQQSEQPARKIEAEPAASLGDEHVVVDAIWQAPAQKQSLVPPVPVETPWNLSTQQKEDDLQGSSATWQEIQSIPIASTDEESGQNGLFSENRQPSLPEAPWLSQISPRPSSSPISEPAWVSQLRGSEQRSTPEPVAAPPESEPPAWAPPVPEQLDAAEQSFLTTLEEMEKGLLSQGFVHLEPKSLSTIARTQEEATAGETAPEQLPAKPQEQVEEPSLSSALAELGNYLQQSNVQPWTPAPPPAPVVVPVQPEPTPVRAPEPVQTPQEPAWISSLRSVPAPAPQPTPPPVVAPAARVDITPRPVALPPQPPVTRKHEVTSVAARRAHDPLLDSDLETTMKRPAVRLQPMQQRAPMASTPSTPVAPPSRETPVQQTRPRQPEPPRATGRVHSEHALSPQERLLKGYQHQLVGDYDEAMQEYRIIIRSSPELLSEIVNNVQALLKNAPRYAAGYRVLGDAYMRQGEYLQAMESYNKALTMAKKAKG